MGVGVAEMFHPKSGFFEPPGKSFGCGNLNT
jgi:hypothetical protein